jgi:hypothetical protein
MVNHKEWASAVLVMSGLQLNIGERSFLGAFVSEAGSVEVVGLRFRGSFSRQVWIALKLSEISVSH